MVGCGNINTVYDFDSDVEPNNPPIAGFTWDADELSVSFTNTSYDPDGDPMVFNWDFGDGSFSMEQNPVHTYDAAGDYTVLLTASDAQSSDTSVDIVSVSEEPPPPDVSLL